MKLIYGYNEDYEKTRKIMGLFDMEKFHSIVGNPPYQKDNQKGHKRTTTEIFPEFQEVASKISKYSSMIYPATWQKDITKGLGKYLLENGLKNVHTMNGESVFKNIILPVSIVTTQKNYTGKITNNGRVINRNITQWVDRLSSQILLEKTKKYKKLKGLEESPNEPNIVDSLLEYTSSKIEENDVKILIKSNPGKQPDSKYFYTNKNILLNKYKTFNVDFHKVSFRSRILGRQSLFVEVVFTRNGGEGMRAEVYEPGITHGSTWCQWRSFKTHEEADNFKNYVNTKIIALLCYLDYSRKTFGSYVPDLEDYTNNNPIFKTDEELGEGHEYYGLTLDERLYKLFNLTDEEVEIIKDKK